MKFPRINYAILIAACLLLLNISASPSKAQSVNQEFLEKSLGKALSLYKQREYQLCLSMLNEIKDGDPDWEGKKIKKYANLCRKNIRAQREKGLKTPQDSWWELLFAEEYDQPASAATEEVLSKYKNLMEELIEKETRLKYLTKELRKLQTDSASFQLEQASRENSALKDKISAYQKEQENLKTNIAQLEKERLNVLDLQMQIKKLSVDNKQKTTAVDSLTKQLQELNELLKATDKGSAALKKPLLEKNRQLEKQLAKKEELASQLKAQAEKNNKLIQDKEKLIKQKTTAVDSLTKQLQELKDLLKATDKGSAALKKPLLKKNRQLQKQLARKEELLLRLKAQAEKNNKLIQDKENQLQEKQQIILSLNTAVETQVNELNVRDKEITQAIETISNMKLEKTSLKNKISQLSDALKQKEALDDKINKDLSDKIHKIEALQFEAQRLRKKQLTSSMQKDQIVKPGPEQTAQLKQLSQELNDKGQLLVQKEKEIKILKKTLKDTYQLLNSLSATP